MSINPLISFENTAVAFSSKSDNELKKTYLLFATMNKPWLVKLGTAMVNLAFKLHLPVKGIIKKTLFNHFCGGESIDDALPTIEKLGEWKISTILDYSAEGEENEAEFDKTVDEQLRIMEYATESQWLPFAVMKISGIASNELLEKLHRKESLTEEEKNAYQRVQERVDRICIKARELNVRVMVDAEETWIQDPIDELVIDMMKRFNQEKPLIWQTFQMYRHDMLGKLKEVQSMAQTENFWVGAKLVRGAYMEKERERAEEMSYIDPIQPDKESTDRDYDEALKFCFEHKEQMAIFAGSHNENSSRILASMIEEAGLSKDHPNYWFGQLYGMSDNISFSLAKNGYNVAKYVPYGPIEKVLPYLFRRAEENTSIAGQSGREFLMVKEEMKRRKNSKT